MNKRAIPCVKHVRNEKRRRRPGFIEVAPTSDGVKLVQGRDELHILTADAERMVDVLDEILDASYAERQLTHTPLDVLERKES